MRRILPLALLCLSLGSGGARAQDGDLSDAENAKQYQACMLLVERAPNDALESAVAWEKKGGGDAARHCQALAYIGLKQYEDGALTLERIAQTMPQVKANLAAALFGQAALAWTEADNLQLALHDTNEGLKLQPKSVDLLVFRAKIYGNSGEFFDALDDLNAANDLDPKRADILILRATAYRHLENTDLARDNIELALKADPDNPDALLEHGIQLLAAKDQNAARAEWLRVLQVAPNSGAAEDARKNLEAIDIKAP
jgi:tetratricopeptide (TPR) repeat protein